ncbi:MAG: flagellar basal body rod protein FlgB [Sedimentisphaerales bacterium]|nr:flagellar basal body rod protein FlgB [Sedimentisphaerales bacterium]
MPSDTHTIRYLQAFIKTEGLRQKAIANNVANLNTPGYRRHDIRFEEIFAKAIEKGKAILDEGVEPEIFQPKNTPVDANGNDVTLDSEVGEMIKNSLRHETYMLLLKKKYAQMQEALRTP